MVWILCLVKMFVIVGFWFVDLEWEWFLIFCFLFVLWIWLGCWWLDLSNLVLVVFVIVGLGLIDLVIWDCVFGCCGLVCVIVVSLNWVLWCLFCFELLCLLEVWLVLYVVWVFCFGFLREYYFFYCFNLCFWN